MKELERLPLKVINLMGAPGSGKSTLAAGLFNLMKTKGYSVEYVSEYAKDLTWQRDWQGLKHQPSILGVQDARLYRLVGQVEWVITDSPLPLQIAYMGDEWTDVGLDDLAWNLYDRYQNYHVLVHPGNFEYDPSGRNQTSEQATVLGNIIDCLYSKAITDEEEWAMEVKASNYAAHQVFNHLIATE